MVLMEAKAHDDARTLGCAFSMSLVKLFLQNQVYTHESMFPFVFLQKPTSMIHSRKTFKCEID